MISSAHRTASEIAATVAGTRFPPSYCESFRAARMVAAINNTRLRPSSTPKRLAYSPNLRHRFGACNRGLEFGDAPRTYASSRRACRGSGGWNTMVPFKTIGRDDQPPSVWKKAPKSFQQFCLWSPCLRPTDHGDYNPAPNLYSLFFFIGDLHPLGNGGAR
jgi:hypothetical protein